MKGTLITSHEFKPFTIGITIESEREAEALFALFCHEDIRRLIEVSGEATEEIRNAIYMSNHSKPSYGNKFQELAALLK